MANKWILPYKQIILENGLLVIYEKDMDYGNATLQVVKIDDSCFLRVGEVHLILLSLDVFDCIETTRKIYLAESEKTDVSGAVRGYVEIDDRAMGKLTAYLEGAMRAAAGTC